LPARGISKFAAAGAGAGAAAVISTTTTTSISGNANSSVAEWRTNRSRTVAAAAHAVTTAAAATSELSSLPRNKLARQTSAAKVAQAEAEEAAEEAAVAVAVAAAMSGKVPHVLSSNPSAATDTDTDSGANTDTDTMAAATAEATTASNLKKRDEQPKAKAKEKRCVKFADTAVLLDAVTHGDLDTVAALLVAGSDGGERVDVNWKSPTGLTALCRASLAGQLEVAQHLLEQPECAVNAQCLDGCTALHLAILEEHTEMVKLLLKHGAASIMNYDGETALDWTDESPELCDIITSHFENIDC